MKSELKKIALMCIVPTMAATGAAQVTANGYNFNNVGRCPSKSEMANYLTSRWERMEANAAAKLRPSDMNLLYADGRVPQYTDGISFYAVFPKEGDTYSFVMSDLTPNTSENYGRMLGSKQKGAKITLIGSDKAKSTAFERIGNQDLMVLRDANGKAVDVLCKVDDVNHEYPFFLYSHSLFDGLYVTPEGATALFGTALPDYGKLTETLDPGPYVMINFDKPQKRIGLCYGEGRVSHGNPASPNYGKVPGGGGARAIMGPICWFVSPAADGLEVEVVCDQEFVDHYTKFVGSRFFLTRTRSAFAAKHPGLWGVASVCPLPRKVLALLPKEALQLMQAELHARHGEKFTDPHWNAYFAKQDWYKELRKPTPLTDLECINEQIINSLLPTAQTDDAPRGQLTSIYFSSRGMRMDPVQAVTLKQGADGKVTMTVEGYHKGEFGKQTFPADLSLLRKAEKIVREAQMWRYESRYEPDPRFQVLDGETWQLEGVFTDKHFSSSGYNERPDGNGLHDLRKLLMDEAFKKVMTND